jgi:hypothetical protein
VELTTKKLVRTGDRNVGTAVAAQQAYGKGMAIPGDNLPFACRGQLRGLLQCLDRTRGIDQHRERSDTEGESVQFTDDRKVRTGVPAEIANED